MDLTNEKIKKIADLARLNITNSSGEPIAKLEDLNNILHFIEKIQNIDTDNVEPMYHSFELNQRLAEDIVSEQNVRDEMQKIVPREDCADSGYYLVPKVVE